MPGRFNYKEDFDLDDEVTVYTLEIELGDWKDGAELKIAAHAVIGNTARETAWADGTRFTEQGNWATYFGYIIEE